MTTRKRQQNGQIIPIGGRWYVRYWERRNIGGTVVRKRATHELGLITTRGKYPPADVEEAAKVFMATINNGSIPPERIVTLGDFVQRVYLPWIKVHKRPSTEKGYRDIWERHLRSRCEHVWLKGITTHDVQGWLDEIGSASLSRNTLKHIKSVVSAIFNLAKQQGYFNLENPAHCTAINPAAAEPEETYAYCLEEIQVILSCIPEPAATAFALAAYMGLREGEIRGSEWENLSREEMRVTRSIWRGIATDPKTRKGRAPVPVIRQLADRLEMHRLRCGNPQSGPLFTNAKGKPLAMVSFTNRLIVPFLNICEKCGKQQLKHQKENHLFVRDSRIPEWHGWHAARRGLGSNLYRLGVPEMVIQRILRHANVSTTSAFYIKTADADLHNAMPKLENRVAEAATKPGSDSNRTLENWSDFITTTIQ